MANKEPKQCHSMTELRAAIDEFDRSLVELIIKRSKYIDRAVELKPHENLPARIDTRVDDVLLNVRGHASQKGFDDELVGKLWGEMIEWSINHEEETLGVDLSATSKVY